MHMTESSLRKLSFKYHKIESRPPSQLNIWLTATWGENRVNHHKNALLICIIRSDELESFVNKEKNACELCAKNDQV